MKMTKKMLAVAVLAVMAFAAFAVVGGASDDDATGNTSASCGTYTVDIDSGQFITDYDIVYDFNDKKFYITGMLNYDGADDEWPLTVTIANSLWYQQSLTHVLVNGERYELTEGSGFCYFEYDFDIVWDAAKNIKDLEIRDNSPVTKVLTFDMTGLDLFRFTDASSNEYDDLDEALNAVSAGDCVMVTKVYTPSYNHGDTVTFGNGYKLTSEDYLLQVVDEYGIYTTTLALGSVQAQPVYYVYKAYDGNDTKYVIQSWNLAPLAIASIECSKNVEYNGEEQVPTVVVKDVNGDVVPQSAYTVKYDVEGVSVSQPTNAAVYEVSLTTQINYVSNVTADWAITPYNLALGDRLKLTGTEGLVYNGTGQTVTVVLDKTTTDLYAKSENKYEITTDYEQAVPVTIDPRGYIEGVDVVSNLSITGIAACTHNVYFNANDVDPISGVKNFTYTIEDESKSLVLMTWTIAQKSIVGISTIEWRTDAPDQAILKGDVNFIMGSDYYVQYEANDGQRVTDSLSTKPYGTWYGVAYGIVNYTGSVQTATYYAIGGDVTGYQILAVSKTDQGKSMNVGFTPIEYGKLVDAKLYVDYTSVKIVNGGFSYTACQKVVDIDLPESGEDPVASVYVPLDTIFINAELTLRYGYGTAPIAYDTSNTFSFNQGSSAWSERSVVTIVDSNGDEIDGAVLNIDGVKYAQGALVPSGVKDVGTMTVEYMDNYGKAKNDFTVSNYQKIGGQVLFDGKKFIVSEITTPTKTLSVSADKSTGKVGEVIKMNVCDKDNAKYANFSVVDYDIDPVDPLNAEDYIYVDFENWTVTASVACSFTLSIEFLNGKTCDLDFQFGNSTAALGIIVSGSNFSALIYTIDHDDGTATDAYEGEKVKIEVTLDTGCILESVTAVDANGNNIPVSISSETTLIKDLFFTMPASAVTVTINAA